MLIFYLKTGLDHLKGLKDRAFDFPSSNIGAADLEA